MSTFRHQNTWKFGTSENRWMKWMKCFLHKHQTTIAVWSNICLLKFTDFPAYQPRSQIRKIMHSHHLRTFEVCWAFSHHDLKFSKAFRRKEVQAPITFCQHLENGPLLYNSMKCIGFGGTHFQIQHLGLWILPDVFETACIPLQLSMFIKLPFKLFQILVFDQQLLLLQASQHNLQIW